MQSSLITEPSIENVLALIASREDATTGLRALAEETGGRTGRRYRVVADRIERGESIGIFGSASASMNSVASLTRFAMLQRSRSETRGHVIAVSLLGWIYLLCSLAVGMFLLQVAAPFTNMLIAEINWNVVDSSNVLAMINLDVGLYVGLFGFGIAATVSLGILFVIRMLPRAPVWIEWLWGKVPIIGPTLRAMDLAEMAESFYQSLASGQDYAMSFGSASKISRSKRLSRWLLSSQHRIEAGESLHGVARDLPVQGEFISGVFGSLASNHTASSVVEMWRETSLRMHSLMFRRGIRVRTVLAPVLVVVSMLIVCVAFVVSVGTLYRVIQLIDALTY